MRTGGASASSTSIPSAEARHAAAGAWAGVLGFLVGGVTQYTFGDAEVAIAMWTALALLMRCAESPASRA